MTKDQLNELREVAAKATQVVSWYPHSTEVRGPFCRWFNVSEVDDQYAKNVASQADDAKFAAAAMNNLVPLLDHIEKLQKEVDELKIDLAIETELVGKND